VRTLNSSTTSSSKTPLQPLAIALVGNPNSGKTSLFNALTGLRYKVANYPGVTVERKEGLIYIESQPYSLVDIPGIYSLDEHSLDEKIAVQALRGTISGSPPDILLCVIDATMLERSLYLLYEILTLEIPVVVALTMLDVVESRNQKVRVELLSRKINVPIVGVCAYQKRSGLAELGLALAEAAKKVRAQPSHKSTSTNQVLTTKAQVAQNLPIEERYALAAQITKDCVVLPPRPTGSIGEKIDMLVTHKVWGLLIFFIIMGILFQLMFSFAAIPMDLIDQSVTLMSSIISEILPESYIKNLLVNGIIPGVGSVLVFLPQIGILFFLLSLLEESGYLVRAAYIMDNSMRRVGLQGRSFIPLLSSFACAIPGIMSTRVIPSFSDRLTTILVAPLMSCSARLPVYSLLISAFFLDIHYFGLFSSRGLMLFALYALGIIGAGIVAFLLKKTLLQKDSSIFVMELPSLRLPSLRAAVWTAADRLLFFMRNTGPTIMATSVLLWALASFPGDSTQDSFAGMAGKAIQPLFAPLGFSWEVCVAVLMSFAAREVFVSSLATIVNVAADDTKTQTLIQHLQNSEFISFPAALSILVFFVFACQCFSTLAVVRRETGTLRWPIFMFFYMTFLAWTGGFIAFQVGTWLQ
jgi:ferrous iron transport protein B